MGFLKTIAKSRRTKYYSMYLQLYVLYPRLSTPASSSDRDFPLPPTARKSLERLPLPLHRSIPLPQPHHQPLTLLPLPRRPTPRHQPKTPRPRLLFRPRRAKTRLRRRPQRKHLRRRSLRPIHGTRLRTLP